MRFEVTDVAPLGETVYILTYMSTLQRNETIKGSLLNLDSDLQSEIDLVRQYYEFKDPDSGITYLRDHRNLLPVLLAGRKKVDEVFGNGTRLILDLVHFYDCPGSSQLFVRIATPLSTEASYPLLTRFDEEWWLNASDQTNNELNFTLEFI
ncbi:MAG TPA: hypothetical protein VFC63_09770 [Blastocatellia bacterium]|nr:hypothetical protein [Blastocatellia bacterium]